MPGLRLLLWDPEDRLRLTTRNGAAPGFGDPGPEAVVAAADVALPLQLALQLAQCLEIAHGRRPELSLQQIHIDVIERSAQL